MARFDNPKVLARIGEFFCLLKHEVNAIRRYELARELAEMLASCGLDRTLTAFGPYEKLAQSCQCNAKLSELNMTQFQGLLEPAKSVAYDDIGSFSIIVSDRKTIPADLVFLNQKAEKGLMTDTQAALIQDTIQCLRAKSYRPAIVMAWCFGFDMIREWIFRDPSRLQDFNSLLQNRTQKDGGRIVGDYQDFYKEKEVFVLDICRDATGSLCDFSTKTHRQLQVLLDERNSFAHANTFEATQAQAFAYVERLIRVVNSPPFA